MLIPRTACLEEEREMAALSLISLGSAAGRAKDLLLLIKMLLRVGYGNNPSTSLPSPRSPASSTGSHGSMNSNNFDDLLISSKACPSNIAGLVGVGPTGAGSRSSSSAASSMRR